MAPASKSGKEAAFARSVLTQNLKVKPGEKVIIEGWSHALPWAAALAREARRKKALPLVLYEDEDDFWSAIDSKEDKILGASPAHEWAALGKTDVYIHMWGPGDKLRLSKLPPERAGKLFAWNDPWYRTARKAGLRGARLEIGRPYPNLADLYGVEEAAWSEQIARASMVDPARLERTGAPVVKALERGRKLRIYDDAGTDLTLGLVHRPVRLAAGRPRPNDKENPFDMLCSLPAGVIATSLDERVADGTMVANRTCFYDAGTATGGVFTFKGGKLVDHHFDVGGEIFEKGFAKGGKGRDQPGLLRIGLNPELHNTPQVEDLEEGAVMVSVGGNRFNGGKNPSPFFGFVINKGARLEIDGKPVKLPG